MIPVWRGQQEPEDSLEFLRRKWGAIRQKKDFPSRFTETPEIEDDDVEWK